MRMAGFQNVRMVGQTIDAIDVIIRFPSFPNFIQNAFLILS